MKTKRVLLLVVLCVSIMAQSFSQTIIGRQKVDIYPITAWGTPTYGLTWLPTDYDSSYASTTKYPLIIFLHGSGEGGDGVGGLYNLITQGLPMKIAQGMNPEANNPVDGQHYKFIVVSPQAPSAAHWSYAWGSIQWILPDVINRYRIDTTRVYVTGISAGGAGTWSCVTNGFDAAQKFPAIVPVSAAGTNSPAEADQIPFVGGTYGNKVWNVCGANDAWLSFATTATNSINNAIPPPTVPAVLTALPGVGHEPGAWNTPYDINWRSNALNLSIFEWMLQYKRTTNGPSANAGANQTITLPTNSVSLSGSGTASGSNTITGYGWTKVSGPSSYTIQSPTSASTSITGLTQGVYIFRLTVTDNTGATAFSDVTVTVNPAPNSLPTANAGGDLTITLPVNTVTLNGSGSDPDGTIASYQWTKIAGPASSTIVNASAAQTAVNNLTQGIYNFELKVTDNSGGIAKDTMQVIVNPAPNQPPTANAGVDQSITLPVNSVTLNGSGNDADGTISSYQWTKIGGPSSYVITNASAAQTQINNLTQGTYGFELTVTDNNGASAKDTVTVLVNPAANVPPSVNAGADQTITLPVDSATVNASANDADGTIASYAWTKISGPASYTIVAPSNSQTVIRNLTQGVYQFQISVTDNNGASTSDTVQITVNGALVVPNIPPVANAGADQNITLPSNSVALNGSGADADGTVSSYAWTKISGPGCVIMNAGQAQTTANNLVQGVYRFELTVTDNNGATAKDTVAITVNAAPNVAPTANAGANITITLPVDSATLNGTANDTDGTIASVRWTKISGPLNYQFADSTLSQTTVTNLSSGTYQFEFTVTDNNGAIAKDTVVITVNAPLNIAPTANAGADVTITLPVDSSLLNGSGTDADGSIVSYRWKKISGPSTYHIADSTQSQTIVNNLLQGVYQFELSVIDNDGAVAKDTVKITVNAALNVAPVVNAGADTSITLPVNSIVLTATASDPGDSLSYGWSKISGPAQYNIASPTSIQTAVGNLVQGTYVFEFSATDTSGAIARDTVSVIVNAGGSSTVCNGVKRYMTPSAFDGGRYMSGNPSNTTWYSPVNAGDTLVLSAQYPWSYFSIDEYNGTAQCPIVIINEGGQTWMTAGIGINSCKYIKITGSGSANNYYGFRIYNPAPDVNGVAVGIGGKSSNIEMERVDVYKKTYGVWAKQDPMCDTSFNYPNFTMDSIEIHHSRFKNIGQDCIYAGNTDPLGVRTTWCNGTAQHYIPMRLSNINIHHLQIDSCNRTGIQLGGANSGYNQIHDNTVTRCGYEYNQQQGTGIAIGGMTRNCHVYNNTISNTFLYGIMSFGVGTNYIENNRIDSTGWLDGIPNTYSRPTNILASPKQTIPFDSTQIIIRNNKLGLNSTVDSANIAIVVWGPPTWAAGNVVCSNTKLNGTTPAIVWVDPSVNYIGDCSATMPNMAPNVNAGNDVVVNPVADTALHSIASDPDGSIISYHWTKVSGPAPCTINSPDSASTILSNLAPGVYVFRVTVMDDDSLTASDDVQISVAPPNVAPVANAGPDQTIILPINAANMTGGGNDADGTVVSYQWTKVSGPSTYTIVNAADPLTQINNLVQGVYKFELKVTDNSGASSKDTLVVMVNAAPPPTNIPPVVNAGNDQSIALPTNSVVLNGSATDPDGTVVSYQWSKISGPASFMMTATNQPQVSVTELVQGVYLFELKATDNQGSTGTDTVKVTVYATNISPLVNAGADQTITLPTNAVVLNGSATDPDGTIVNLGWAKIAGPAQYTIGTPNQPMTPVTNLVQGVYQFELTAMDNLGAIVRDTVMITVNPAANVPPVVNAGSDQTITLPVNTVNLAAVAIDIDGYIANYQWTKIAGPSQYAFANANTAQTAVNNLAQGVYQFEISVTDNNGAVAKDTVQVTVNAAVNVPPLVNAGADQVITLPVNSVNLSASAMDIDGTISSYQWAKISGPAAYAFSNASASQTSVNNLVQGVYQFEITVTDNNGAIAKDTVQVTVNALVNVAPTANAGIDQVITLPTNYTTLSGTGTDVDGTIVTYQWSKISGPLQFTIVSSTQPQTLITNLVQGVYRFELAVTDNNGAVGRDTVQITVNTAAPPPNVPPVANAGADQTITLPTNTVAVNGTGIDVDGTIVSTQWRKISGPLFFTIANASNAQTTITNLITGVYKFEFSVTDNQGATGKDTMTITVNQAPVNVPPVAHGGGNQTITLPTNSITVNGNGTDGDGTVVSYLWTKISGPAQFLIASPVSAQTTISNLVQGTYEFELKVTDNQGAIGRDTVVVVVNAQVKTISTVTLYPNPVATTLNIKIDATTHKNQTAIRIYNMSGILVYEEEFLRSQPLIVRQVDVSKLLPGAYTIVVGADINNDIPLKFIKE